MTFKAVIHANRSQHQTEHASLVVEGLGRHGIECETVPYNEPHKADFCIMWGWRQHSVINHAKANGMPILVMERGHLQPRMEFTSFGWNGLGGRGTYPKQEHAGSRWGKHWGHMDPWKWGGKYALVIGQVPGDASIVGVDFNYWVEHVTEELTKRNYKVKFRPHPLVSEVASLADDLKNAELAVTFNSTAAVECVLAGVPTMAFDRGSMAWPVTTHFFDETPRRFNRSEWVCDLACCQWNAEEIRSGEAWEAVKQVMPCQ